MNAIADTSAAHPLGRVFGLSNEEYHAGPGVSKSQLDQIAESPATYIWAKNAPLDQEKLKAFDMGSAIHCLLLEPDEFESRFIIAPPFNRRTNAGKAEAGQLRRAGQDGDGCRRRPQALPDARQRDGPP